MERDWKGIRKGLERDWKGIGKGLERDWKGGIKCSRGAMVRCRRYKTLAVGSKPVEGENFGMVLAIGHNRR